MHATALQRITWVSAKLSDVAAAVSAVLVVYITLHFLLEIVLRAFFSTSSFGLAELVGYAMGATTFLALGHAFRKGALIRVQLAPAALTRWPLARFLLEVICLALTLACAVFLCWYFLASVRRSFDLGNVSYSSIQMPQWIPESILLAGLSIFTLQVAVILLQTLAAGPGGPLLVGSEEAETGH